jgi:hypothetical protein
VALLTVPLSWCVLAARENSLGCDFLADTKEFVHQPLKWDNDDYIMLGFVTVGTILTMPADQPIREEMMRNRSYDNSFMVEGGRTWGEWYTGPILAGAFALHGAVKKNDISTKIGCELIEATAYAASVTQILKIGFGRARPYVNGDPNYNLPFSLNGDYNSFPSGHVTNAFAISTVLAKNTDSNLLKVVLYTPAVFTAFSRMYQDQHWASDCVLGAAIGYFCASWVVDHQEQKKSSFKITSIYPLTIRLEF